MSFAAQLRLLLMQPADQAGSGSHDAIMMAPTSVLVPLHNCTTLAEIGLSALAATLVDADTENESERCVRSGK